MMRVGRLLGLAIVGLGALGATACEDSPVGPSLGAVPVTDLALRASQGDVRLCCCHVTGQARNDNSVAVHVTLKFAAFNTSPQPGQDAVPLSTILHFLRDMQPGEVRRFEAPGFIFPCDQIPSGIGNVKMSVEVKGITYPPF
jgi:hypothetical protein